MSIQAQAVIGALYGDEGKGLMVDRLAAEGGLASCWHWVHGGADGIQVRIVES